MNFLGKYAKACVPSIVGLSTVVERYVSYGDFDRVSLGAAVAGLITSLAVAIVPNSKE